MGVKIINVNCELSSEFLAAQFPHLTDKELDIFISEVAELLSQMAQVNLSMILASAMQSEVGNVPMDPKEVH